MVERAVVITKEGSSRHEFRETYKYPVALVTWEVSGYFGSPLVPSFGSRRSPPDAPNEVTELCTRSGPQCGPSTDCSHKVHGTLPRFTVWDTIDASGELHSQRIWRVVAKPALPVRCLNNVIYQSLESSL